MLLPAATLFVEGHKYGAAAAAPWLLLVVTAWWEPWWEGSAWRMWGLSHSCSLPRAQLWGR